MNFDLRQSIQTSPPPSQIKFVEYAMCIIFYELSKVNIEGKQQQTTNKQYRESRILGCGLSHIPPTRVGVNLSYSGHAFVTSFFFF